MYLWLDKHSNGGTLQNIKTNPRGLLASNSYCRIKTCARNKSGHTRLTALASPSMEEDLLMELQHTDKLQQSYWSFPERKENGFVFKWAGVAVEVGVGERKHVIFNAFVTLFC